MEIRVGFEPTINSFAGCPLQPLEYRIMAGILYGIFKFNKKLLFFCHIL